MAGLNQREASINSSLNFVVREGIPQEEILEEYGKWATSYEDKEDSVNSVLSFVIREGISQEEVIEEYGKWAASYDDDLKELGYEAYDHAANKLCELYPPEVRDKVRILDIGAGTGLLGIKLKGVGFTRVDGLDPCKKMLDVAEKRGLYQKYYVEYITEKPLDIQAGSYDVVVGVGMIGYSMVPWNAVYEMLRLTKTGGHVVLSIREIVMTYEEHKQLQPTMDQLEKSGRWKTLCRTVYPNFFKDCNGILFAFQIL